MAEHRISIHMNRETAAALTRLSFHLYGFKAVRGPGSGAPAVWLRRGAFPSENVVRWGSACRAYTSGAEALPNAPVVAGSSYDVAPGETLVVTSPAGTGSVQPWGTADAVSILNQTPMRLTCGIAQAADGVWSPVGAFPLFPLDVDLFAPVEQVFLMLSTRALETGTVLYQAPAPGVMVDLAGVDAREVRFDVHEGWGWPDGAAWARAYPAYTELAPLLIQSSVALEQHRLSVLDGAPPLFAAAGESAGEAAGDEG